MNLSYTHGASNIPLSYQTIGQAVTAAAHRFGSVEALVSVHQGIRMSYAELDQRTEVIAANLLKLGLTPGDRVGIWAPNCFEWTLIQYATSKAGLILVNINPAYRKAELVYALNKVECRALVMAQQFKTSNYVEMMLEIAPEIAKSKIGHLRATAVPSLDLVVCLGANNVDGFLPYSALEAEISAADKAELTKTTDNLSPDDPINIQFTSGTTGSPKGATLTHFNILNNGSFTGAIMELTDRDRLCVPVPLYHCFGMVLGNLACLQSGATVIYPDAAFSPETTLQTVEGERCTALYGVPAMFSAILDSNEFPERDVSSLRTGMMAGAPCPIELMKRVISDLHMPQVTIGYGMTETSPLSFQSSVHTPLEKRVTTVGQIHPHVEVRIADKDGKTVRQGESGELLTRGYSVMRGYWNDAEKSAEAIDPAGWMHTGDLATMDEDGYCNIVGRIKDVIIRGGENIFPAEIENYLYTHPGISEAAIFGVPDTKYGEAVALWVKPALDTLTAEDIRAFCKDNIAHYKIPKYISIVSDFPRTVTGKIQKFKMREAICTTHNLTDEETA